MEKIEIIFLGTSSAIPTVNRNHTSIFMKYKEENFLIDCGEGTQRQFRKAKINPCKITRLLITHLHGDHVFGIPGLFQTLNLNNYQKTLRIYGPKGTKKFIGNIFNTFLMINKIKIKTEVKEVSEEVFETSRFRVFAAPLEHGIPTLGYVFQEKDKLRIDKKKLKKLKIGNFPELKKLVKGEDIIVKGKKLKSKDLTYIEKGRKISFIFDTELCSNIKKLAKNSDLLVIEATFLNSSNEKNRSSYKHLTLEEAVKIAKESKVKKVILTHFSQRHEFKEKFLLEKAKKIFKNSEIAKDFMQINL